MPTKLTRYEGFRYVMRKAQGFSTADDANKTTAGRAMLMSAGILMQTKSQTCSVAVYSEETNTISAFNIPLEKIAGALARHASFDVPLDDFHNQIDDDFARRLGGMVLLTLASRSQVLKNQLSITIEKDPEDRAGPPSV